MTSPIIEINNLCFAYNGEQVLQDVDLVVRSGDFIAMIGPNGGGKTTLLKLMLGLLKPDRGTVRCVHSAICCEVNKDASDKTF